MNNPNTPNEIPLPACPQCNQSDEVLRLGEAWEKADMDDKPLFAPPAEPRFEGVNLEAKRKADRWMYLLGFGGAIAGNFIAGQSGGIVIGLIAGIAVYYIAYAIINAPRTRQKRATEDQYDQAVNRWHELLTCQRCQVTFHPAEGVAHPLADLRKELDGE